MLQTAIITGATGFVGIHLVNELLKHGVKITALCRENSPNMARLPSGIDIAYSPEELGRADVFYHLAWEGASGPGRSDPLLQNKNAQMAMDALIAAKRLDCGKFIGLGTIYEKFAPQVQLSDKFGGADFYILSKDYAHSMTKQMSLQMGIEYIWCTICHPIGKYIKPEQMAAYAISHLMAAKSPSFGSARTLFDIVAVEDVALGLYLLGQKSEPQQQEYYIGSGDAKPLYRWLEDIKLALEVCTDIGIGQRPDDKLRFEGEWLDISPISEEVGYMPQVSLKDAVKNVALWLS